MKPLAPRERPGRNQKWSQFGPPTVAAGGPVGGGWGADKAFFFFFKPEYVDLLIQIRSIFSKKSYLIGSLVVLVKWFAAYLYVLFVKGVRGSIDRPCHITQRHGFFAST